MTKFLKTWLLMTLVLAIGVVVVFGLAALAMVVPPWAVFIPVLLILSAVAAWEMQPKE